MSRHALDALDPKHDVVVGWDPPLHTFFAQVIDTEVDEDDGSRIVLWIAGVPDTQAVIEPLRPFARIPKALHAALWCGRLASVPR